MADSKTSMSTTHKDDGSCEMTLRLTLSTHAENGLQARRAMIKELSEILAEIDAERL